VQLWWQQFFLRSNVIFCTKTSLISYGGCNSSQGSALVMSRGMLRRDISRRFIIIIIIIRNFFPGQSPPVLHGSRRLCLSKWIVQHSV